LGSYLRGALDERPIRKGPLVTRWRVVVLIGLFTLVGLPLFVPAFDLLSYPSRLFYLLGNTILLVAGTLIVAMPLGVAIAVLLYRTNVPLRGFLRFVTVLGLFVPLAVSTTAWHSAFALGGWLPTTLAVEDLRPPWLLRGFFPAIWIHATAALPWIILMVGQGLCWVEAELEEDALQTAGPLRVLWHVTLPRCRAMLVAAALWTALSTAAEITVADRMQIRTFAEVVYYEFWLGGPARVARAIAESLPLIVAVTIGLLWTLPRLERHLPPLFGQLTPPRLFLLGRWRWPCLTGLVLLGLALAGVPLASLIWNVGLQGYPPEWSARHAWQQLSLAVERDTAVVLRSLAYAFVAGGVTAGVALIICWLAVESRWFRLAVLVLVALGFTLPGPVVGIGMRETILAIVTMLPFEPVPLLLYTGPSPVPVLWAHLVRFLPFAIAVLWPMMRLLPPELRDRIRTETSRPHQELIHVVAPLLSRGWLATSVIIAALVLGDVGTVAICVEPPGWEMFAHVLFARMHYAHENQVYALCLLLLSVIATAGAAWAFGRALWSRFRQPR
jgi:iron(III) transport system permease protein